MFEYLFEPISALSGISMAFFLHVRTKYFFIVNIFDHGLVIVASNILIVIVDPDSWFSPCSCRCLSGRFSNAVNHGLFFLFLLVSELYCENTHWLLKIALND